MRSATFLDVAETLRRSDRSDLRAKAEVPVSQAIARLSLLTSAFCVLLAMSANAAAQTGAVVAPGSAILNVSQTAQFTLAVDGAAVSSVAWTRTPSVGAISSSGLYTAPATVSAARTVTIKATTLSKPAMSATATVTLMPVTISLTPGAAALTTTKTQQFTATVGGTSNNTVTWSLAPNFGTVSPSGLYMPPSAISSAQTVMVTAASAVDPTKSATAVAMVVQPGQTTFREAGANRGLLFGAAADVSWPGYSTNLLNDPGYAGMLALQYNMLEPANELKWSAVHPAQNTYNFGPGDQLVAFAQTNGMKVRGHNLCWYAANPDWLNQFAAGATPSEMATLLENHINTVVKHYKGKVFAWDVVNEAVSDYASGIGTDLVPAIWYNQPGIGLTGTGYVEQAFRWAHNADPNALLFYNEYGIESPGPKFDAVYNMLKDFVSRGVPINGVGLEMHVDTSGSPTASGLSQNIQRLTALGLQVHITEMDVRIPVDPLGNASPSDLAAQADVYKRVLTVCLQNPGCTALQTFGLTDKYSWIPFYFQGYGDALPFDVNYQPKPAFGSMMSVLEGAPAQ